MLMGFLPLGERVWRDPALLFLVTGERQTMRGGPELDVLHRHSTLVRYVLTNAALIPAHLVIYAIACVSVHWPVLLRRSSPHN